ncbi:barstar family protein [Hymenobacter sp. 5516J-16]|uniref:Barstar family protein n=1 Tax=Hymenobacter sublimis TaxID=2933777 RepID=A0ABY4JEY1_9BACT|nr:MULTISPECIES: barstar family protein [Hymenobacter]UOQ76234.1 barstar family protein [Hymenobacter sp. 5516J-16]UPL49904.1 barstar family protein [Hymenobacter sublimis]
MTLDLTGITSKVAIHQLFKEKLGFEEWYGPSWDAFWDSIVAIAEMPPVLTLTNWEEFAQHCPHDMGILRRVIQDYNQEMAPKRMALG